MVGRSNRAVLWCGRPARTVRPGRPHHNAPTLAPSSLKPQASSRQQLLPRLEAGQVAVAVKDLVAVRQKVPQAVGDREDDRRNGLGLHLAGEPGVEIPPGSLGSHRAVEVDEVIPLGRGFEDVGDPPLDALFRDPQPRLEALADLDGLLGDLDLDGPPVRVQDLEQEALEAVAGAEVGADGLRADPSVGLEDRRSIRRRGSSSRRPRRAAASRRWCRAPRSCGGGRRGRGRHPRGLRRRPRPSAFRPLISAVQNEERWSRRRADRGGSGTAGSVAPDGPLRRDRVRRWPTVAPDRALRRC